MPRRERETDVGTIAPGSASGTFPFWSRHRYARSERFPPPHVVLAGKAEHLLNNRLQALTEAVRGRHHRRGPSSPPCPGSSAASPGTRTASTTTTTTTTARYREPAGR